MVAVLRDGSSRLPDAPGHDEVHRLEHRWNVGHALIGLLLVAVGRALYVRVDSARPYSAWRGLSRYDFQHATAAIAYGRSGALVTVSDPGLIRVGSACRWAPDDPSADLSCLRTNMKTQRYFDSRDVVREGENAEWAS
jgi:hypothetical protein